VATPEQDAFRAELLGAGLVVDSGVPGLYGHSAAFDAVVRSVDRVVTDAGAADSPEHLRFPPVLPREYLERNDYLVSFPHLAGTVSAFDEDLAEHPTDVVLTPSACYPAYPVLGARGPLPAGGTTLDLGGAGVFRNEPSGDPARLRSFRQREMVRLGEPETVASWRDVWRDRAVSLLRSFGLAADAGVATDPFFGRSGRLLARSQREQELKFEVCVPIASPEPTAVASFNYHQEHFTGRYGIAMAAGGPAHTACLGFGLERVALALFRAHGLDSSGWPVTVRQTLGL
jgi:seryl-tRNA synthetase